MEEIQVQEDILEYFKHLEHKNKVLEAENHRLRKVESKLKIIEHKMHEIKTHYESMGSMVESITDAFFALDSQWNFTYINDKALRTTTLKREELIGRNIWVLFPGMMGLPLWKQLHFAMQSKVTVHFEIFQSKINQRSYEYHVYPSKEGLSVYFRDITEKYEADRKLRLSEERFSTIFNSSPDMMLLLSYDDLKVTNVNQSFLRTTGLSEEQVIGHVYTALKHQVDLHEREQMIEKIKSQDSIQNYEVQFRQPNGEVGTSLVSGNIIDIAEHKYILIVANNITEKKKMEQAICTSENRFRNAFNYSGIGMALVGLSGSVIRANASLCNILGFTEEELISLSFKEFTHPEDLEMDLEYFHKMILGEISHYQMEKRYIRKDGQVIWANLVLSAVRDGFSRPSHFVAQVQDITDRKKLQQEMLRLDRLNTIGQMAAGIGHEIRNPMTAVRGFLQLLQRKKEFSDSKDILELMVDELDRANSIISEFLSLAKNKDIELKMNNLKVIIRLLYPLLLADAMKEDKYIELDLEDIPDLLLDEKQIRQLILNLVRNGVEAMQPGGTIIIRTWADSQEVVVAIKDQGSGIDSVTKENIGTPFFTTKDSGTGLGMAICYSIAERHNAVIDYETSEDGTTFFIRFSF